MIFVSDSLNHHIYTDYYVTSLVSVEWDNEIEEEMVLPGSLSKD